MKQRKNTTRILRAAALVLLTALGVTMLCGADRVEPTPAGEAATGNAAQTKTAEVTAATNTPMSYEEYFSQRRELKWQSGAPFELIEQEISLYGDDRASKRTVQVLSCNGQSLQIPLCFAGNWSGGSGVLLFCEDDVRSGCFLLTESALELIAYLPAGWHFSRIICSDGLNVCFFEAVFSENTSKRAVYRYYDPSCTLELVMDYNDSEIMSLMDQSEAQFDQTMAYTNEDIIIGIRPGMKGVDLSAEGSYETYLQSEAYASYLQKEYNRQQGNPERQAYIKEIMEHCRFHGLGYINYIAYHIPTKTTHLLCGVEEFRTYVKETLNVDTEF